MTLVQPILVLALLLVVIVYFARLRSKAFDALIVLTVSGFSFLMVIHPDTATRLARAVGVGRGVDLVLYLAIPTLLFLILILFSKLREIDAKVTAIIREHALSHVRTPNQHDTSAH